ncbi:MAG: IS66 family insertion sequence element accessory protein TnpB [Lachnospiraceae bacterium]|nr:IS66 family insertion sequence element accessory protein TnpB [Lachnospiraceae bacterium]
MSKYSNRRSDNDWLHIIQECRQSGMSDSNWCEQNNISINSFYNAVTRLRKKACDIPMRNKTACAMDLTSRQDIVQIDICPDSCPGTDAPAVPLTSGMYLDNPHTIELSMDGIHLKISNSADPALLGQVIRLAKAAVSC